MKETSWLKSKRCRLEVHHHNRRKQDHSWYRNGETKTQRLGVQSHWVPRLHCVLWCIFSHFHFHTSTGCASSDSVNLSRLGERWTCEAIWRWGRWREAASFWRYRIHTLFDLQNPRSQASDLNFFLVQIPWKLDSHVV